MSMSSESEEDEEDCGDSTKAKHMCVSALNVYIGCVNSFMFMFTFFVFVLLQTFL